MATGGVINLNTRLNPPTNLAAVANQIRRGLGNINANINVAVNQTSIARINNLNQALTVTNSNLRQLANNASLANSALGKLGAGVGTINSAAKGLSNAGKAASGASSNILKAGRSIEQVTATFSTFVVVARTVERAIAGIGAGTTEALEFQQELVRLKQVGDDGAASIKSIGDEAVRLGKDLGISSNELLKQASTLRQAGLSAKDTQVALETLAKTKVSPSFTDAANTVEGMIAIIGQFGLKAADMERAFSSINTVSKRFAVESNDLITGVRLAGAAFSASGGKLEEFLALFTAVRSQTRESAESIGNGLKTIFARLQRSDTVDALKNLGINLRDAQGNFVGAFEAIQRIGTGLSQVNSKSQQFADIVQEIGGVYQLNKILPLISNQRNIQIALNAAKEQSNSLDSDAAEAQSILINKLVSVKENFLEIFKILSQNKGVLQFVDAIASLTKGLASLLKTVEPLVPALLAIGSVKLATSVFKVGATLGRKAVGFQTGGKIPGQGSGDKQPILAEAGEFMIKKSTAQKVGYDSLAHFNETGELPDLPKFAKGGKISKYRDPIDRAKAITGAYEIPLIVDTDEIIERRLNGSFNAQAFYRPKNGSIYVPDKRLLAANSFLNNSKAKQFARAQYERGHASTQNIDHVIKYEVGHALSDRIRRTAKEQGEDTSRTNLNSIFEERKSVSTEVGRYAGSNSAEFVAETFAGLSSNKKYSKDVVDLYTQLYGALPQKKLGFNTGGRIPGHEAGDKQEILAESGEFMIKKSAARKIGYGRLNEMNRTGDIPKYATGGEILGELTNRIVSQKIGKADIESYVKKYLDEVYSSAKTKPRADRGRFIKRSDFEVDVQKQIIGIQDQISEFGRRPVTPQPKRERPPQNAEYPRDPGGFKVLFDSAKFKSGPGNVQKDNRRGFRDGQIVYNADSARNQGGSLSSGRDQRRLEQLINKFDRATDRFDKTVSAESFEPAEPQQDRRSRGSYGGLSFSDPRKTGRVGSRPDPRLNLKPLDYNVSSKQVERAVNREQLNKEFKGVFDGITNKGNFLTPSTYDAGDTLRGGSIGRGSDKIRGLGVRRSSGTVENPLNISTEQIIQQVRSSNPQPLANKKFIDDQTRFDKLERETGATFLGGANLRQQTGLRASAQVRDPGQVRPTGATPPKFRTSAIRADENTLRNSGESLVLQREREERFLNNTGEFAPIAKKLVDPEVAKSRKYYSSIGFQTTPKQEEDRVRPTISAFAAGKTPPSPAEISDSQSYLNQTNFVGAKRNDTQRLNDQYVIDQSRGQRFLDQTGEFAPDKPKPFKSKPSTKSALDLREEEGRVRPVTKAPVVDPTVAQDYLDQRGSYGILNFNRPISYSKTNYKSKPTRSTGKDGKIVNTPGVQPYPEYPDLKNVFDISGGDSAVANFKADKNQRRRDNIKRFKDETLRGSFSFTDRDSVRTGTQETNVRNLFEGKASSSIAKRDRALDDLTRVLYKEVKTLNRGTITEEKYNAIKEKAAQIVESNAKVYTSGTGRIADFAGSKDAAKQIAGYSFLDQIRGKDKVDPYKDKGGSFFADPTSFYEDTPKSRGATSTSAGGTSVVPVGGKGALPADATKPGRFQKLKTAGKFAALGGVTAAVAGTSAGGGGAFGRVSSNVLNTAFFGASAGGLTGGATIPGVGAVPGAVIGGALGAAGGLAKGIYDETSGASQDQKNTLDATRESIIKNFEPFVQGDVKADISKDSFGDSGASRNLTQLNNLNFAKYNQLRESSKSVSQKIFGVDNDTLDKQTEDTNITAIRETKNDARRVSEKLFQQRLQTGSVTSKNFGTYAKSNEFKAIQEGLNESPIRRGVGRVAENDKVRTNLLNQVKAFEAEKKIANERKQLFAREQAQLNQLNFAFSRTITAVQNFAENVSRAGERLDEGFNQATFASSASLGERSTQNFKFKVGDYGPQGQKLEQFAGKNGVFDNLKNVLPSIIEQSIATTRANPGVSIQQGVTSRLEEAGFNKNVTDVIGAGVKRDDNIQSDFLGGRSSETVDRLLKPFDSFNDAYKKIAQEGQEAGRKFVEGLNTYSANLDKLNAGRGKSDQLDLGVARESARRKAFGVTGGNETDFLSVGQLQQPFNNEQQRLTGLGNRSNDVQSITGLISQRQKDLAAGQATNDPVKIQGAQTALAQLNQALENLADTGKSTAGIQEKLAAAEAKLTADRQSRLSSADNFINASQGERRGILQNRFAAQQAIAGGSLSSLQGGTLGKQSQRALEGLKELGDQQIITGYDKKGKAQFNSASNVREELLKRAVTEEAQGQYQFFNDKQNRGKSFVTGVDAKGREVRQSGGQIASQIKQNIENFSSQASSPQAKQIDQLRTLLDGANTNAKAAQEALNQNLQQTNAKLIDDLRGLFQEYFGKSGGTVSVDPQKLDPNTPVVNGQKKSTLRERRGLGAPNVPVAQGGPELGGIQGAFNNVNAVLASLNQTLQSINIPSEISINLSASPIAVTVNGSEVMNSIAGQLEQLVYQRISETFATKGQNLVNEQAYIA